MQFCYLGKTIPPTPFFANTPTPLCREKGVPPVLGTECTFWIFLGYVDLLATPSGCRSLSSKKGGCTPLFFEKCIRNGGKGKAAPALAPDAQRETVSSENCVKHYFIYSETDASPLDGSAHGAPARQRTADRQPAAGVMPTTVSLR